MTDETYLLDPATKLRDRHREVDKSYALPPDEQERIFARNVGLLADAGLSPFQAARTLAEWQYVSPEQAEREAHRILPDVIRAWGKRCQECGAARNTGALFCSNSCQNRDRHRRRPSTYSPEARERIAEKSRAAWDADDGERRRRHAERTAAYNKARRGVPRGPRSPEARAAISAGMKKRWAAARQAEAEAATVDGRSGSDR